MGMGEPLLNLGAVLESIRVLTAPVGLGLGHRSLSISTVGIPSGILRLARTEPQVNLALSLHAADDATRALLIPEGFRHPLAEILEAAWEHFAITGRKLLVEYVLLAGRERLRRTTRAAWPPCCADMWSPSTSSPGTRSARRTAWRHGATSGASATHARLAALGDGTFHPSSPAAVAAFRATSCGRPTSRRSSGRARGPASRRPAGNWPARSESYEKD